MSTIMEQFAAVTKISIPINLKIYPETGDPYRVYITVDNRYIITDQIEKWVAENLKNVARYEFI